MNSELVSVETLAKLLADFEKAALSHKEAEGATQRARNEETSRKNYLTECRKRYEAAYNSFWQHHDREGWREKNDPPRRVPVSNV